VRFVVQQHSATTLHYDFRLEVGDVLRSWAVPKGPSTDPADKRLAVQVEDHSLASLDFEGVHEGQRRGTGAVIIWDQGTYVPLTDDFAAALDDGHASFLLEGEKLTGGWTLHRTGGTQWLLIKRRDGEAGRELWPESVRSGRTIDEL
jgi:bifunctional non-homologous end joining protein LigD